MRAVVNTGPLIKLAQIKRLELLKELYEEIYAPQRIKDELKFPIEAADFLNKNIEIRSVTKEDVIELSRKLDVEEGESEVFILYRDIVADEMIFANKKAENKIGKYGYVRDIIFLKDLAETRGVFSREDSKKYLEGLKKINYRPRDVEKELEKYL